MDVLLWIPIYIRDHTDPTIVVSILVALAIAASAYGLFWGIIYAIAYYGHDPEVGSPEHLENVREVERLLEARRLQFEAVKRQKE